jgi:hypothetical protein
MDTGILGKPFKESEKVFEWWPVVGRQSLKIAASE